MSFFFLIFFLIVIIFSEKIDDSKSSQRNLQSGSDEFQNIKIYIDDNCIGSTSSSQGAESQNRTDIAIIKTSIQKAKNALEKLIKVKKSTSIYLNNDNIPDEFKNCAMRLIEPINVDLAIFIRWNAQGIEYMDFPRASILNYFDNDINNRPIMGTVVYNFNLQKLGDSNEHKIQAASTIFLHEFTHILGFNRTIFQSKNLIKEEKNQLKIE